MLMIYIESMSEKHTAPKSPGELLQKWMNSVVAPAFVENQDNPDNYIKILNTGEKDKNGKMVGIQYNEPIMIKTKVKIIEGLNCSSPNLKNDINKMIGDAVGGLRGELLKLLTDHEYTPHGGTSVTGGTGGSNPTNKPEDWTCDAFPEYGPDGKPSGDAKYISVPITKNMTESQANSKLMIIVLANVLGLIAIVLTFYFVTPPIYISLLRYFAKNMGAAGTMAVSTPLVRMHAFEGLVSFIIIAICMGLTAYEVNSDAPTWMAVFWLVLVLMVSSSKNTMTRAAFPADGATMLEKYYGVTGTNDGKNEFGTKQSRATAILYHMFCFFPVFPLAFIVEQMYRKGTAPPTGFCPPPLYVWNT